MAIKKHEEIRLNVKPMFLTLYHEYVFEGPCRFGEGMQLEKEFDLNMAAQKFKGWYKQLQDAMPADVVNLLEPVKVERDENFLTKDEMIEKLAEGSEDVDLYYIGYASRPYDLALEFAMRVGKPCAITQACCASAITSAEFLSRGLEFYSFEDWADATEYMTVLRARKVLKDSKILAATRMTSAVSVSSPDSVIDPEKITAKFGTRIRYVSAHELLDQISYDDPMSNHCTPGRMGLNLTAEDEKVIDKKTDELIDGAVECQMTREMVKKSVEANHGIRKFLDEFECNCFTAPCPDLCATRRLNQKQFTMCLNHSLNNEDGIPSACEYDLGALVSKLILQSIGREATKDITFTVHKKDLEEVEDILNEHKEALRFDHIEADEHIGKVSIVGVGLMSNCGVAAKMFEALYEAGINIQMINTSEIRVSVLLDEGDVNRAVKAIHAKFFDEI